MGVKNKLWTTVLTREQIEKNDKVVDINEVQITAKCQPNTVT